MALGKSLKMMEEKNSESAVVRTLKTMEEKKYESTLVHLEVDPSSSTAKGKLGKNELSGPKTISLAIKR